MHVCDPTHMCVIRPSITVLREDVGKALPFMRAQGVPFMLHAELVTPVDEPEVSQQHWGC